MKKMTLLIFTVVLLFTLSACGPKHNLEELQNFELDYTVELTFTESTYEYEYVAEVEGDEFNFYEVGSENDSIENQKFDDEYSEELRLFVFIYLFIEEDWLNEDMDEVDEDYIPDLLLAITESEDYSEEDQQEMLDYFEEIEFSVELDIEKGELIGFTVTIDDAVAECEIIYE